ncbi:cell adhesion molecule CEACAM6-like [Synchiropus picturatus]
MALVTIIGLVSVAYSGLSEADGVLPDSLDAAVGGTVMFSTTLPLTETPVNVEWSYRNKYFTSFNIIRSFPSYNSTIPEYEGRITLFPSTGALELRDVLLTDTGFYSLTALMPSGYHVTGSTDLRVHVPITGAQLSLSSEDLLEFNSSVTFSCSVSAGSSLSFLWQNISSEISASDGVRLTDGGAKLTVLNVTRYDQGPFRCSVFNPVSRVLTDPLTLSISYGPDNAHLQIIPHFGGVNIGLRCSSSSNPPARFQWFMDDTLLPNTGAELLVSSTQNGYYSCQAFNSKTSKHKASCAIAVAPLEITPRSAVIIAAIVALCGVVMIAAAVGGFYFSKRRSVRMILTQQYSDLCFRPQQYVCTGTPQEEDYDQLTIYENAASLRST